MGLFEQMKGAASQAAGQAQAGLSKAKQDFGASRNDAPALDAAGAASGDPRPLVELMSHIAGKNAKVRLWPDRLEWEQPRGLSGGKLTAGMMTGGLSLLATGVKGGKEGHDMVLLKYVTNVTSAKDGLIYHAVTVQTASGGAVNNVTFRVNRDEAAQFRASILKAMQALEEKASAPIVVTQAAPPAALPVAAPDFAAQLQQLASLRDAGILTEEEFVSKKTELLSRM
jgi:hypothetical protein